MSNYVFLLLDQNCRVFKAEVLRAADDASAITSARNHADGARSWGYEVWRRGRQVVAVHDCNYPPARIGL